MNRDVKRGSQIFFLKRKSDIFTKFKIPIQWVEFYTCSLLIFSILKRSDFIHFSFQNELFWIFSEIMDHVKKGLQIISYISTLWYVRWNLIWPECLRYITPNSSWRFQGIRCINQALVLENCLIPIFTIGITIEIDF